MRYLCVLRWRERYNNCKNSKVTFGFNIHAMPHLSSRISKQRSRQQLHSLPKGDSDMSTPVDELRQLLEAWAARAAKVAAKKAAKKNPEAPGPDPSRNKETPEAEPRPDEGAIAVIPIMAVDPAAVPGLAQPPVIDLEPEPAVSRSSGKRALDLGAAEADTGKKRPWTRRAGSAGESHGESRLAAKEIPALPALPIHSALPEEGEAVLRDEQSRLISRTWESGRDWRDETYKALTIRCQVEFAERPSAFSVPQPIVDRLATETGFRPKLGQDTTPFAADLLEQVGNTMSNLQLKRYATIANLDMLFISQALRHQATADALLSHRNTDLVAEAAVNQREAAKEALAREMAQAQETLSKAVAQADVDRAEFDRVKAGLEEALSRKETAANERAALLEAAAAQSVRDGEKIQNLETRVRELDNSLREEMTANEEARRGKEQAEDLLHVTFEEAIYMAWRKDKSMNLLIFPDSESKRAEFEAKEKEDAELLEDEA
ncbi:uncharacterized protein LOC133793512 isoform X2 [Humulus lupulus]|uniref:uncharacterized protein LOC133793512 isoform X2 n=1 Tax=Humulus lupulus TaxID=3486 RepID=UPI002B40CEEC|nr:uncharacterized protein LOC133793512 isoform X2 [Humulus lupulus]